MSYAVKEIFYTLQGEGYHTGRPAVFCRFSGCNLWSGREADRSRAICQFCDTDFVGIDGTGGGKFDSPASLVTEIGSHWPSNNLNRRFVVCTGGEPLLQLDPGLIDALHQEGFQVAVETNGTVSVPMGIDWLCVSPKAGSKLKVKGGDELKVVFPQAVDPTEYDALRFDHFFVQPMDGPNREQAVADAIDFCKSHPKWRLSLQTHKFVGIR
ncbi:7-carboxy-7-deazaguanine synthase [Occallatibacter savannae]|uniref:7-carboxy-7-deazaguanine synthase n=1 Tax=Occallatibacter savannae TaxID=1002691 RepID=UPI000D697CD4|nr:7-carboxy-7-deazaguanine synthase [Occallatibacter savannae]